LEDRLVPSTFVVTTLSDGGAGSLRQAIQQANVHAGADVISFDVAGTIELSSALPAVTGEVDLDGTTAPGYAGTPVVQIAFDHFGGLQFVAGSKGSELSSLSLVGATGAGLTVSHVNDVTVTGNYIGVDLDGETGDGNSGNGVLLLATTGDTIGTSTGGTFQLSNVISGNGGNGIEVENASGNIIAMNTIGTDATGTVALGNDQAGILITGKSANNLIGGTASGGNDPTNAVFVRPPEGNLISGNFGDGVLIANGPTGNQLSGNFIGTDTTGLLALGNAGDGVAVQAANGNQLIGCTAQDDPFVYYNVISGNAANGLRVTNSNNTTIQANFFGMGSDNNTALGNTLDGVLVNGSSSGTVMGGPIPLGNVDACNGKNGIEVAGTARFFTTYNTFCGLAAFSTDPDFGNAQDGMLITSTGGNILIRTNVITENGGSGIEVAGAATGVRIAGNLIGLDTQGNAPMGNIGNGIEVDGTAHNIVIGGPQPTFNVIPHNAIAANGSNGVAVEGQAHAVTIDFSFIGTDLTSENAFGNGNAGIYLGAGTSGTMIGSLDPSLVTVVSGNDGDGIEMNGTHGNTVVGTLVGTDGTGVLPLGNGGNGINIVNSSDDTIGSAGARAGVPTNVIAFNSENGVIVQSASGNQLRANSIYDNSLTGIDLGAGANKNAAAPVLTSLNLSPFSITVTGTLTSTPKSLFVIEFFASDTNSASGRIYLGSELVKTNASGVGNFTFKGPQGQSAVPYITATATDVAANTSEFSDAVSAAR
jgi:parallel beta-helix repeat protein